LVQKKRGGGSHGDHETVYSWNLIITDRYIFRSGDCESEMGKRNGKRKKAERRLKVRGFGAGVERTKSGAPITWEDFFLTAARREGEKKKLSARGGQR